jgi:hypothetical protein
VASVPEIQVFPVIMVALAYLSFLMYKHYDSKEGSIAITARHASFAGIITFTMLTVWTAALVAEHNASGNAVIGSIQDLMTVLYQVFLWVEVLTIAMIILHFGISMLKELKNAALNKKSKDPLIFNMEEFDK